jgi:ubiquinone/menaquinone biosynthesis C-methylase UbiE
MESITSENYLFRFRGRRNDPPPHFLIFLMDRYHGIVGNPYPLPNDEDEAIRLDELQYAMRTVWGGNVFAPISRTPTKIIDVGTGSGDSSEKRFLTVGGWAIEVADEFPTARVIGLDLSPIQPTRVPLNCEFIVGDLAVELEDFYDGNVDLVHSRYLYSHEFYQCRIIMGGVLNWDKYIADTFRILKPGTGYAQMSEMTFPKGVGDSVPEDSYFARVFTLNRL